MKPTTTKLEYIEQIIELAKIAARNVVAVEKAEVEENKGELKKARESLDYMLNLSKFFSRKQASLEGEATAVEILEAKKAVAEATAIYRTTAGIFFTAGKATAEELADAKRLASNAKASVRRYEKLAEEEAEAERKEASEAVADVLHLTHLVSLTSKRVQENNYKVEKSHGVLGTARSELLEAAGYIKMGGKPGLLARAYEKGLIAGGDIASCEDAVREAANDFIGIALHMHERNDITDDELAEVEDIAEDVLADLKEENDAAASENEPEEEDAELKAGDVRSLALKVKAEVKKVLDEGLNPTSGGHALARGALLEAIALSAKMEPREGTGIYTRWGEANDTYEAATSVVNAVEVYKAEILPCYLNNEVEREEIQRFLVEARFAKEKAALALKAALIRVHADKVKNSESEWERGYNLKALEEIVGKEDAAFLTSSESESEPLREGRWTKILPSQSRELTLDTLKSDVLNTLLDIALVSDHLRMYATDCADKAEYAKDVHSSFEQEDGARRIEDAVKENLALAKGLVAQLENEEADEAILERARGLCVAVEMLLAVTGEEVLRAKVAVLRHAEREALNRLLRERANFAERRQGTKDKVRAAEDDWNRVSAETAKAVTNWENECQFNSWTGEQTRPLIERAFA